MTTIIRLATPADSPALCEIYRHYVLTSTATFDLQPPSLATFAALQAAIQTRYPYLVAEAAGTVVGYAYAHQFSERAAYDPTVEATVYLRPGVTGGGLGRKLYAALERELKRQHVVTMTACVTAENVASCHFHERLGFTAVGRFEHIAYKCDRWLGIVWFAKALAPATAAPQPLSPYPELQPLAPRGLDQ